MKHWKKYLLGILFLSCTGYMVWKPLSPLSVQMVVVAKASIAEYIEEEAKAQLNEETKIFPSLSGFLGPVDLDVGDWVSQGQIVAKIDPVQQKQELEALAAEIQGLEARILGLDQVKPKRDEYEKARLMVAQAKTEMEIADKDLVISETQFQQTKRDWQRIQSLHEQKIAPPQEWDAIQTQYQLAQEALSKVKKQSVLVQHNLGIAQTNLRILQDAEDDQEYLRSVYQAQIAGIRAKMSILESDLQKTEIKAPYAGIVLERTTKGNVHLSFVTPDYYILRIGNLNSLEIRVDLLSDDIHKVQLGQKTELFGPCLAGKKIYGKVSKIYPSAFTKISSLGIEQQRVTVIISVEKQDIPKLSPGYRVDARIFTREVSNALVIPSRAVFNIGQQKHCFVANQGKAKLTKVEIGIETDEEVEICQGLQPGQWVVVDPPNDLKHGRDLHPLGESQP